MKAVNKVRIIGVVILLGLLVFLAWSYLLMYRFEKELKVNLDREWYGDGAYVGNQAAEVHLHDTYYVIFSPQPWAMVLIGASIVISLLCLCRPKWIANLLVGKPRGSQLSE